MDRASIEQTTSMKAISGKAGSPRPERLAIAKRLSSLTSVAVELNFAPKRYFSLDLGNRPNKNAVIIPKFAEHVSFYIENPSIKDELVAAGFNVEPFPLDVKRQFNKNKHKVFPLSLSDIDKNEALIRQVLNHSLEVIQNRKTKK